MRYNLKYKNTMKRLSEAEIQAQCYRWLINNYGLKHHNPQLVMFSIPNEIAMVIRGALQGTRLPARITDGIIATITQKLKNTGLRPGVSDTVVVMPGKTLFVEFKTETGYQSEKQKEFQKAVESCRQQYHVVRSLEEFKSLIESNV